MIGTLFITFFKIGLFTFGGGYGMISLVRDECVEKKKWVSDTEFMNLIAVAESTPGPIAINMATYVGYKMEKLFGAIIATIGVVLPSMIIITIISYFINDFLNIKVISFAFFGIRVAVAIIITRTAFNLIVSECKGAKNKLITILLFIIYTIILFSSELFRINIPSVGLILSTILLGIIMIVILRFCGKEI